MNDPYYEQIKQEIRESNKKVARESVGVGLAVTAGTLLVGGTLGYSIADEMTKTQANQEQPQAITAPAPDGAYHCDCENAPMTRTDAQTGQTVTKINNVEFVSDGLER
ncbi:MAG: hypothetical protein NC133_03395 [Prevotella sp.]|nr:hypothetical protein [Prevotella sp.]